MGKKTIPYSKLAEGARSWQSTNEAEQKGVKFSVKDLPKAKTVSMALLIQYKKGEHSGRMWNSHSLSRVSLVKPLAEGIEWRKSWKPCQQTEPNNAKCDCLLKWFIHIFTFIKTNMFQFSSKNSIIMAAWYYKWLLHLKVQRVSHIASNTCSMLWLTYFPLLETV